MNYLFFSIFCGILSLGFGWFLILQILKKSTGEEKVKDIAQAIEDGAKSFLKRQYKSLLYTGLVLFILISYFLGLKLAIGFLIGALASALAGYIGMMVSVKTNLRVTTAAKNSLDEAFKTAFNGGAVTGFMVMGLGLLSISLFYLFGNDLKSLVALGFGASLVSVFGRLGGGIYTKAADVGADLVGKVEAGIPEDDPRNPAVIADNVGDNVGDCAGMAADLFETYVVTIIASMIIGNTIFLGNEKIILFPLLLADLAVIGFIISSFFASVKDEKLIMKSLYRILIIAMLISAISYYPLANMIFGDSPFNNLKVYFSLIIGFIITLTIVGVTEYYTSKNFRPVQSIAQSSQSGPGTNIISGLSISLESTFLPVMIMILGMIFSFKLLGLYGIALSTMSMLSLAGVIIAIDSFGPITDNAGGIAEMSQAPANVRKTTDALDAVGNTTKAVTKGYAIISAGFSALVLFSSYVEELNLLKGEKFKFDLNDPYVLIGLFLGASLPFLFSSMAMRAVGRAAYSVVEEVRSQFKDGEILRGSKKPDYSRTVDIVTQAALKEMIWPSLLPLIFTTLVGFILGPIALGGFLIGTILTGVFVAISMTTGGGAWDNAKKFIEEGNYGGKGSETHKAAVVGDTVGDPYKDTAGPAINPMIKVVNIIALLIASFIV